MAKTKVPKGNFSIISLSGESPQIIQFGLFKTRNAQFPIYLWTIDKVSVPYRVLITLELIDDTNGNVLATVASVLASVEQGEVLRLEGCGTVAICTSLLPGKVNITLFEVNTNNVSPSINQVEFVDPKPAEVGFCRHADNPRFPTFQNTSSCSCSCFC